MCKELVCQAWSLGVVRSHLCSVKTEPQLLPSVRILVVLTMSVKLSICTRLKNASSSSCAFDISTVHILTGKSSLQSGWNLSLLTNFWLFFWLCCYCHCNLPVNFNLKVKLSSILKPLVLCNVDFSEWGWRPLHHILRQTYKAYCKQKAKREIYVWNSREAFNCQVFLKKR